MGPRMEWKSKCAGNHQLKELISRTLPACHRKISASSGLRMKLYWRGRKANAEPVTAPPTNINYGEENPNVANINACIVIGRRNNSVN